MPVGFEFIPPQYDHPPKPPMQIIERRLSYDEIQKICAVRSGRALMPGQYFYGCGGGSLDVRGNCIIWLLENADDYQRRHEIAHCNGWPGNHPAK